MMKERVGSPLLRKNVSDIATNRGQLKSAERLCTLFENQVRNLHHNVRPKIKGPVVRSFIKNVTNTSVDFATFEGYKKVY